MTRSLLFLAIRWGRSDGLQRWGAGRRRGGGDADLV